MSIQGRVMERRRELVQERNRAEEQKAEICCKKVRTEGDTKKLKVLDMEIRLISMVESELLALVS